jgi:photosystem II stability/assembly factor-like uncharacterized protein
MRRALILGSLCLCVFAAQNSKPHIVYRWDIQHSGVQDDLKSVFFLDTQRGWAAGDANTVVKTTDGGTTWARLTERQEGGNDFREVVFTSPMEGWVAGPNTVMHTSDGGESWEPAAPLPGLPGYGPDCVRGSERYEMHSPTAGAGVYRSDNGGQSWALAGTPPRNDYSAVFFLDGMHGWVAGAYRHIALTADGGRTWKPVEGPLDGEITKIQFVSPSVGWILPHRGHAGGPLATTDGGLTWRTEYAGVQTFRPLADFEFLNPETGFLLAEANNSDVVFHTANGGKTWRTIGHVPGDSTALSFPKADEGWVVGAKGYVVHYHRVVMP